MAIERMFASATVWQGKIYVMGGLGPLAETTGEGCTK